MKTILSKKFRLFLILLAIVPITAYSQVEVKWTSEFNSNVLWQEVTSLGNLIVSTQNELYGIDIETGQIKWSNPVHARLSRVAYIGASSYYVAGAMASAENEIRQEDAVAGEMVSQIGDAYGELGNAATGFAGDAFRMANARKKATQSGRDFMFMMSKRDKDILLLKVSKYNGEVEGEILLGKDREPIYAVDDITGQVYYLTGENEITSYQVK